MKRAPPPRCPSFERTGGRRLHHSPALGRPCTQAILKSDKHGNKAPATIGFDRRNTDALHGKEKWRLTNSIRHLKYAGKKVRWRCKSLNKRIQIICTQGIKCLDELRNLVLGNTYNSADLTQNATSVNAGNKPLVPNLQAVTDSMFVVSSLEHRATAANVFSDLSFVLSQTKLFVKRKVSAELEGEIIIFELA